MGKEIDFHVCDVFSDDDQLVLSDWLDCLLHQQGSFGYR